MKNNRREFIKKGALSGIGLVGLTLSGNNLLAQSELDPVNPKNENKGDIRVGFISVGRNREAIDDT
jgi:hypothetical protein